MLLKPIGLEEMEEMEVSLRHILVSLNNETIVAKRFRKGGICLYQGRE